MNDNNNKSRNFRQYPVWQDAVDFATYVYKVTSNMPWFEKKGLCDQLQRASVSIGSNIAEGSAKPSDTEFAKYLDIALGSSFEVETQLLIARNVGYIDEPLYQDLQEKVNSIERQIQGLNNSIRRSKPLSTSTSTSKSASASTSTLIVFLLMLILSACSDEMVHQKENNLPDPNTYISFVTRAPGVDDDSWMLLPLPGQTTQTVNKGGHIYDVTQHVGVFGYFTDDDASNVIEPNNPVFGEAKPDGEGGYTVKSDVLEAYDEHSNYPDPEDGNITGSGNITDEEAIKAYKDAYFDDQEQEFYNAAGEVNEAADIVKFYNGAVENVDGTIVYSEPDADYTYDGGENVVLPEWPKVDGEKVSYENGTIHYYKAGEVAFPNGIKVKNDGKVYVTVDNANLEIDPQNPPYTYSSLLEQWKRYQEGQNEQNPGSGNEQEPNNGEAPKLEGTVLYYPQQEISPVTDNYQTTYTNYSLTMEASKINVTFANQTPDAPQVTISVEKLSQQSQDGATQFYYHITTSNPNDNISLYLQVSSDYLNADEFPEYVAAAISNPLTSEQNIKGLVNINPGGSIYLSSNDATPSATVIYDPSQQKYQYSYWMKELADGSQTEDSGTSEGITNNPDMEKFPYEYDEDKGIFYVSDEKNPNVSIKVSADVTEYPGGIFVSDGGNKISIKNIESQPGDATQTTGKPFDADIERLYDKNQAPYYKVVFSDGSGSVILNLVTESTEGTTTGNGVKGETRAEGNADAIYDDYDDKYYYGYNRQRWMSEDYMFYGYAPASRNAKIELDAAGGIGSFTWEKIPCVSTTDLVVAKEEVWRKNKTGKPDVSRIHFDDMQHLMSRIRLYFAVHPDFHKIRRVVVTQASLSFKEEGYRKVYTFKNDRTASTSNVHGKETWTWTADDRYAYNPKYNTAFYSSYKEAHPSDMVVYQDSKGEGYGKLLSPLPANGDWHPENLFTDFFIVPYQENKTKEMKLHVKYIIYDTDPEIDGDTKTEDGFKMAYYKKEHLVRECQRESTITFKGEGLKFLSGVSHALKIMINPDYIYVLGDHDEPADVILK